jgi:UDP-N-acetylmuramate--alanine ligase
MIAGKMKNNNKKVISKNELLNWIDTEYTKRTNGVLITAGAGDIDTLVNPIKEILIKRI